MDDRSNLNNENNDINRRVSFAQQLDPNRRLNNNPGLNPNNINPQKEKRSVKTLLLTLFFVICIAVSSVLIAIEKDKARHEPQRVAGDAPIMTQNKKVPKDRKEFFYVNGDVAATTEDDQTTEEGTDDVTDEDGTDDGTEVVSNEDGTTENPFAYILDQSGKDDAANNGGGSGDEGKTYGKHEVFDDMLEAGTYLSYLVDRGVTGMVDIYITGGLKDVFGTIQTGYYYHNICANLSGTYYYSQVGEDTYRINITITRSECGYVYRNIVYGEKIPEDKERAIRLREEVEKVYNECVTPGMSDFEIELALHDRVISQCKYLGSDSPYDVQHSAYGALIDKEAVCDGYSKAFTLLLTRAGIDSQVVYGTAGGGHAWNQVKIDGSWYMVDSTWDDPEYSSKKETAFHPYFNVSDEYLSLNHKWMNEGYNACTTMKDNYFNHYGYVYSGQSDYESALKERIKEGGSGVYESVITDSYSVDNAFVREVSGGRFSEYYNDILNDYYFSNVIVK